MPSSGMRSRRKRLPVLEGLRDHGHHRHGTRACVQEQVTATGQGDGQETEQMTLCCEKGMLKRYFCCLYLLYFITYLNLFIYFKKFI